MTNYAFIALGSNLSNPEMQLDQAIDYLNHLENSRVIKKSSYYITQPIDCPENTPDFLNAVIKLETNYSAQELITKLLIIEKEFGRTRQATVRNQARILDLDILLFNQEIINLEPSLIIPHPRMHQRAFVLYPLLEIEPQCYIPNLGKAEQFLKNCQEQSIEVLSKTLKKIA